MRPQNYGEWEATPTVESPIKGLNAGDFNKHGSGDLSGN